MTWTYDAQAFRSRSAMGAERPFVVSFADAGGAADRSMCLVDLNAATAAEWPHKGNASGTVVVFGVHIEVDVGSSVGEILLGFVTENDATDGTITILYDYDLVQGDRVIDLDFTRRPIFCDTDFIKYRQSGNYTVLQNDATYTATAGATGHNPAVGDLVLIYDHDTAAYTRLTATVRYTVL